MLSDIPIDQFAAAIETCAAELLWESGIDRPPVDAMVVAERLGLVIARNNDMQSRGRFVRLADATPSAEEQGTIVVGPAERPERLQWTIAHEIGESVAYRVFTSLGASVDVSSSDREMVANHLASCLLLPREWFVHDGRDADWDLFSLKARYATASHELIARRMLEMSPPIVVTLCDQGRVCWRRANSGGRPPKLLDDEIGVWRESHASGNPASAVPDASTGLESIHAWPIHEPGWKRELIRSAIAEW